MKGDLWRPYLRNPPHPDYPAGTPCFCSAIAQASRLFFKSDNLNYTYTWMKGSSYVEPGTTPATTQELKFDTWSFFEIVCKTARLDGGVHTSFATDEGMRLCQPMGQRAYTKFQHLTV
jgi:hypothetical protein